MSARKTTVPIPSSASATTSFHGFCRRALGIIEESSSLGDAFKAERSGRARLPNSRKGSRREMTLRWYTSHNTGKLPSRRWRNPRLGGSRDVAPDIPTKRYFARRLSFVHSGASPYQHFVATLIASWVQSARMEHYMTFEPIYQERVWGGQSLCSTFGRRLPDGCRIGESWELVDREEAQSVVQDGPYKGWTLHRLWTERRPEIFGSTFDDHRFPILIKILDATDKLSVQVHPPATLADELQGQPKTEVWYFVQSEPGAQVYAGLKKGVTRGHLEQA